MKKARLLVSIYYFQVLQEHTHERFDDDENLDADGNFVLCTECLDVAKVFFEH